MEYKDLNITIYGIRGLYEGLQAYAQADQDALEAIVDQLEKDRLSASMMTTDEGGRSCGRNSNQRPNSLEVNRVHVMEMELRAMLADLEQQDEKAADWFLQATELQANLSFTSGPPYIVYPSWELYGQWLLQHKRPAEAKVQFERSLQYGPERLIALEGLSGVEEAMSEKAEISQR